MPTKKPASPPNIADLSIEELNTLVAEAQVLIAEKQKAKKRELIQEFRNMAKAAGLSLEDVVGVPSKAGKGKTVSPPKYQNPDNPEETWTGKGRKPRWIVKALEEGKEIEDFAI